jgi:hypothetical protein
MAKTKTIAMDKATMKLVAALATITAAHIMAQLFNRGVFTDDDLEFVFSGLAQGGLGDPGLDTMAKAMADSLRSQIIDIRLN